MARKKHEEEQGAGGGWISTFADLMNLLLCFFVLLFSMSTVDADKYEQLVTSMSERINIFSGGGSAVGEGAFVSSGTDQLVSVSQYFKENENSGDDAEKKEDQDTQTDNGDKNQDGKQSAGEKILDADDVAEEKYKEKQEQDQKEAAEQLYSELLEDAQNKNIEDQININTDKQYQYVQISLNGALLFESGDATIKKSMMTLMSKVGDILKQYKTHRIKIEGHTDNVPISGKYSSNMVLSTARANTVFEYLVKKKGMSPKKYTMEIAGMGEYDPVASNSTAKGRAQNRRVEIKIYTGK
jgi:chemotaxis protein MotB